MKKLIEIQQNLKAPKSNFNSFGKYAYRSCEDILEAVKPLLAKAGLVLTISDKQISIGDRYYVEATATLHGDSEPVSVTAYAREEETKKGMDASQITGSASSYARKYALNGLFLIDDVKDADSTNTHGKDTPKPATKPPATTKATDPPKELDAVKQELRQLLLDRSNGDPEAAKNALFTLTSFTAKDGRAVPGKRSVADLSDRAAEIALKELKKDSQ